MLEKIFWGTMGLCGIVLTTSFTALVVYMIVQIIVGRPV